MGAASELSRKLKGKVALMPRASPDPLLESSGLALKVAIRISAILRAVTGGIDQPPVERFIESSIPAWSWSGYCAANGERVARNPGQRKSA